MAKIKETAGQLDIVIEQGATWYYPFTWKDENNDAVNITGYLFKAQIRKKPAVSVDDPPVIITLNSGDEIVITDGPAGEWSITISDTITSEMPNGNYQWDMFVKYPGGRVVKLWKGDVEFIPNVTEPSTGA